MDLSVLFFTESILLGLGLAMDAFSVSLANGLNEPCMKKSKMCFIGWLFACFQFAMPLIGWVCVHTMAEHFAVFYKFVPWIALVLLCFIGGKMIVEGVKFKDCGCCEKPAVGLTALLVQGVATSIDALSVGFTIADYDWFRAFLSCLIIGIVTFALCVAGVYLGKKFGTKFAGKANFLGGSILIFLGIEIFISGLIG